MIPKVLTEQAARLKAAGVDTAILEVAGQCYVLVRGLSANSPPWDRGKFDILIAVPATYEQAGLDGFYLCQPHKFKEGNHPRVNGETITVADASWRQVSWHYADGHPWTPGTDNLETHVKHCHGFFSGRGATNGY